MLQKVVNTTLVQDGEGVFFVALQDFGLVRSGCYCLFFKHLHVEVSITAETELPMAAPSFISQISYYEIYEVRNLSRCKRGTVSKGGVTLQLLKRGLYSSFDDDVGKQWPSVDAWSGSSYYC